MEQVLRVADLTQAEIDKEVRNAHNFVFPDGKEKTPNDVATINTHAVFDDFCRMFYGLHTEPPLRANSTVALNGDFVIRDPILPTLNPESTEYKSRRLMLYKLTVQRDYATALQMKARLAEEKKQTTRT